MSRRHAGMGGMVLLIVAVTLACSGGVSWSVGDDHVNEIRIDASRAYQKIEGFGASGAWWPHFVDAFSAKQQQWMLEQLFGPDGAALSIYRYNIPAGSGDDVLRPERRTPHIETKPFEYDLTPDAKALAHLAAVRRLGVEHFVLFSNSPPPRLTRSGTASGGEAGGSNLRPGAEEAFARYLVDITQLIKKKYDLPHVTLSPVNEPQWRWGEKWRGQEGCHYTPEEAAKVLRATLDQARRADHAIRVEGPESGEWKSTMPYLDAMFADPVLDKAIDCVAIHSYWSTTDDKRRFMTEFDRKYPGKSIAMTEFGEMQHGQDMTMDAGLRLARVIHDDLTIGQVVSWQWWLAIGGGGYEDGLVYANPEKKTIEISHRLWVLGQYSRFVRPGARRVHVQGPERLRTTAFVNESGAVACVVVNDTADEVKSRIFIDGSEKRPTQMFVSDKTRQIEKVATGGGGVVFPARSVCTIVFSK